MTPSSVVEIALADPRTPEIMAMITDLDRYLQTLYPAESNHLVDVSALAQPNVQFFAARVDGVCRGCGAIMVQAGGYAEVKRVYVSPAARGLGLGRRILEQLQEATRAAGLKLMRLETGISQPEALQLFESAGFSRCPAFGDYPADDPLSLFLEKHL